MEEKRVAVKEAVESILDIFLRSKRGSRSRTNLVHEPTEVYASPEEGVRLIRAFIRIKQPELRAAFIALAIELTDD